MKQKKNDITIIGGGVVGSLLALILGLNGFKVSIIDQQKKEKLFSNIYNVKSYALNEGSCRLLNVLKIWDIVKKDTQPISKIILQQGSSISSIQPFELIFTNGKKNDYIFNMIEEIYLKKAILEKIDKCSNIEYLYSSNIIEQKIDNFSSTIVLENGLIINSDLVVGSDGYPSSSAKEAKIKHFNYNYNQSSIVGIFKHEIPHDNEAVQIFLPSGPLAILPLPGNRSSFVWTMENNDAKRRFNLNDLLFLKELNTAFQNKRGKIELEYKKNMFPISLALSKKVTKEKFVIIGDTSHKIHPIAGQGLNLGIRDVATLAEVLIFSRRLGEDIGSKSVLDRYSKWRNLDTLTVVFMTDFANKIFSNNNYLMKFSSGIVFKLLNNSNIIKKYLMKEASGLSGDIPKLLKGENI
ncbi:MAG: FAD-dependent monooxygenase [Paracoccaceae bacterium]